MLYSLIIYASCKIIDCSSSDSNSHRSRSISAYDYGGGEGGCQTLPTAVVHSKFLLLAKYYISSVNKKRNKLEDQAKKGSK